VEVNQKLLNLKLIEL